MIRDKVVYWIWLAEQCGYGSKYFTGLYELYEDPYDIYRLEPDEIFQLGRRFPDNLKDRLCDKSLDKAFSIYKTCVKDGIEILTYGDVRYPERLRLIVDPPIVLYCLGRIPAFNDRLCIGVVGTRKMTRYGRAAAYRFSYELSSLGACIVSGLALGVDATAACGALEGGEPTVQVLGCGVNIIYPKTHSRLREAVIKNGALLSEYPPFEDPKKYYFPQRNRIISGISHGVFVTECRKESGAMITASIAMGQGKELFAFPGNVGEPTAEGPNELLRKGAYAALSSEDIVLHYQFLLGDPKSNSEKLSRARANAIDVTEALRKYSIPDKCEENERINHAPLVSEKYDPTAARSKMGRFPIQESIAFEQDTNDRSEQAEAREDSSAPTSTARDYGLDPTTARVFESIPCNAPVSVDRIVCEGLSTAEVVTALTMLEIMGLVSSLPGGLYIRK